MTPASALARFWGAWLAQKQHHICAAPPSGSVEIHPLVLGESRVLLVKGAGGWGEARLVAGYASDPELAVEAALEAALLGPLPPLREVLELNALVEKVSLLPQDLGSYSCVKVKVGRAPIDTEVSFLSQLRDLVGQGVAIRVDANGSWGLEEARVALERMARIGIAYAEQPVRTIAEMAKLRRSVDVPLAADECVRSLEDLRLLRRLGGADVLVIKVAPVGGPRRAMELAESFGGPVTVSSMMETSVGLAVGAWLAAALPGPPLPCGLATLGVGGPDIALEPLVPQGGKLYPRPVEPDPALLEMYRYRCCG